MRSLPESLTGRFTKREREIVKTWAEDHKLSPSELVRRAVLEYVGVSEHGGRESGGSRGPAPSKDSSAAANPAVQPPAPPKDPAPAIAAGSLKRADRLAKLDLNDMALRVWNFSRSAERSTDPLAYIREVIRHAAEDRGVLGLTEQELAQILGQLKERSTTVRKLLQETTP